MTQNIIVDSCGWVAIIDASINFESELERMFGSYNLILIDLVEHELQDLENDRPKRRSLLLDLLKQKSISMKSASLGHTDDLIFDHPTARQKLTTPIRVCILSPEKFAVIETEPGLVNVAFFGRKFPNLVVEQLLKLWYPA